MSTNNFSRVGVAAVLFISLAIYRGSKENENIPISSLNQKTEKSSIVKYYLDTTIIGTYQDLLVLSKQNPQLAAKNSADAVLGDTLSRVVRFASDERSKFSLVELNKIENSLDKVLSSLYVSDSLTWLAKKLIKNNYENKILEKIRIKRSMNSSN